MKTLAAGLDDSMDRIEEIAIIGIACRFPGARNKAEYWNNIVNGVCSIKTFTREECLASGVPGEWLDDPKYVRRLGRLDDPDLFDAEFFGYSPKEAEKIDPQQRIFLECAWEAMEDAGYVPDNYDGSVGVFAGSGLNYYLLKNVINTAPRLEDIVNVLTFIGNEKDFLSTRVSYKLNLKGPSYSVQSACSTSMVAVHLGCQSLLSFECDAALCGGVSLQTPRMYGYLFSEGEIFSPDGQVRAFDRNANGTLFGEGAGVVLLKRLSEAVRDRDHIYAVIKSTAVNNDGAQKVGYTAPSVTGQADVVRLAQGIAGITAEDISCIEAHGTGTPMGDPIEVTALTRVFRETCSGKNFCALGSVKANIGHLDVAAGVAGLIKTALCLEHRKIPPQINFNDPNPELRLGESPFYIATSLKDWPASASNPRRAGVSSFGMGGTNAHAVLEEAPVQAASAASRKAFVFNFSAAKKESLLPMVRNFSSFLEKNQGLNPADMAYTLNTGRKQFPVRYSIAGESLDDLIENIKSDMIESSISDARTKPVKNVVFLFPGQGSEYQKMGHDLYHNDGMFKNLVDSCAGLINKHSGNDILKIIFGSDPDADNLLHQTQYAQAALFAIEYSLASYLISLGVKPSALIGHSLGEITAACVAGIFSLEDAVRLVLARGKALQGAPEGSMMAALINEEEAKKFISDKVYISNINSEKQCVFSGESDAIMELGKTLEQSGVVTSLLKTKKPFHTPFMEPALAEFRKALGSINYHEPVIKIISNVSGDWGGSEMSGPDYWERHVLNPVRFKPGSEKILDLPGSLFVEIGPGNVLSGLIRKSRLFTGDHRILASLPHHSQQISAPGFFYKTVGKLYEYGLSIDWEEFYKEEKRHRVSLPPYVFNHKRYWIEPARREFIENINRDSAREENRLDRESLISSREGVKSGTAIGEIVLNAWKESLGYESIRPDDNFFDLGGNSLIAAQIISRINKQLSVAVAVLQLFKHPSVEKLAAYLDDNAGALAAGETPVITPRQPDSPPVLSSAQKRLWFFHEYDTDNPAYNLAQSILISGDLSIDVLMKSLAGLIARHEIFRTSFRTDGGEPRLVVGDKAAVNIEVKDYTRVNDRTKEEVVLEHIKNTVRVPFDFEKYPLYKFVIYRLSHDAARLVLFIPHILSDGWSFDVFQRELESLYFAIMENRENPLKKLEIHYSDYAAWQNSEHAKKDYSRQIDYWKNYLPDSPPILQLPCDYNRPADMKGFGDTLFYELAGPDGFASIQELGARLKATNFSFILSALSVLFHKYSAQESIILGIPYAGRENEQVEGLMGFFLNMLPIMTDFSGDRSFSRVLERSMADLMEAVANNDIHFEQLVEILHVERYKNIHPVFQVMVAYQNYMDDPGPERPLTFRQTFVNRGISEYDLAFYIWEEEGRIVGAVEYSTELFRQETVSRMLDHLKIIIGTAIKDPEIPVSRISIIAPEEKERMLNDWNNTYEDYSRVPALPDMFYTVAGLCKNKIAVRSGRESLTYQLLNEKSNRLARYLVKKGAGPGSFAGVFMERNADMLMGLLGILKAGAAYIPLDPSFPVSRLELMIADSKLRFIVTQSELKDSIAMGDDIVKIVLDAEWDAIGKESDQNLPSAIDKNGLAYVLYTSGSTGIPNGVQISHKALINFLLSMKENPGISPDDTMLALTTLSFDIAGLELFLPLVSGASIELITHEQAADGYELRKIIKDKKITMMQATPATYQVLFEEGWTEGENLKVLCGGEAMPLDLAGRLVATGARVWNMYGPTETTIWSSLYPLTMENLKPLIGKPIANTQFYVLDKNLDLAPPGIAGELHIGGDGLAEGYLNRDELTKKRFIPNPFTSFPGSRIYKTGDMVRYLDDGNVEYLGRMDFQVKLRGYRIELEDIETVIGGHPSIRQVVCKIIEFGETDKRIVAYVRVDENYHESDVKNYIGKKLPDYMLPGHFYVMERFPLTPNGKIDRKALPQIDIQSIDTIDRYYPPENEKQKKIAAIWQQVLGRERIGIYDNFFELGGHSLLATKLIHRLNGEMDFSFKLRDLFANPTVAGLARTINSGRYEQIPLLFPAQPIGEKTPFFLIAGVYNQFYYKLETTYEEDFLHYFNNLIVYFRDNRPVYGFRPRGIFLNEKFHADVGGMAKEYVAEIKRVQPKGPYIIGGECLGGIVAYELARQLIANGDEVALLILLDTYKPDIFSEEKYKILDIRHKLFSKIRAVLQGLKDKKISYIRGLLKETPGLLAFYRKVYLPVTGDDRNLSRVHRGSTIYAKKLIKYRPRSYNGEAALIINEEWNRYKPNLGWSTRFFRNVTIKVIPGDHTTRLTTYGEICGKTLAECIEKAMSNIKEWKSN